MTTRNCTLVSQRVRLSYFTARKTETVGRVQVFSGDTAAGATPTLLRVGIWTADSAGALLALVGSTANDTALFASTEAAYTRALQSNFTKQAGQRYAFGVLCVTAATAPTAMSTNGSGTTSINSYPPRLCGYVEGQADLPASVAVGSISNIGQGPFGILLPPA